jgi:Spy/CpxP family protein refolding chaperone
MSFIQKQKKWSIVIAILMGAMFCVPGLAGAFGGKCNQGKGFGMKKNSRSGCGIWRNQKLVQDLGLSEDQVKKLKDIDFSFREKQLKTRSQMAALQLEMDKELSTDKVEEEAVLKLAKKLSDIKGEKYVQEIESNLAVRKILTQDQIKKLNLYRMSNKQKGHGWGKGKGFGQGNGHCPKNRTYSGGGNLTN